MPESAMPFPEKTPNAIELRDVRFAWSKQSQFALCIPQFEVSAGSRVFLYGASGSGKTTLMNILSGLFVPQQGQVRLFGTDVHKLSGRARDRFRAENIGVIFQQFNLLPYLNVEDNIRLAQHFSKNASMHPPQARIGELLDKLSLSLDLLQRKAQQLSVGQQQRVAVARALINHPKLIIADEPTSALDSNARDSFLQLLLELTTKANSTVIFVSHDQSLAPYFDQHYDISKLNQTKTVATDSMGPTPC